MISPKNTQLYNRFVGVLLGMALLNLVVAYSASYFFNIRPCILCVYTRYIYIALIVIAFSAYRDLLPECIGRWLMGGILLFGTLFGIYHLGVENHWWPGTAACYTTLDFSSLEALHSTLATTQLARCDTVHWRLLGVSATLWNALWFVMFFIGFIVLHHCFCRKKAP